MRALYCILRIVVTLAFMGCVAIGLAISVPFGALVLAVVCWQLSGLIIQPPD